MPEPKTHSMQTLLEYDQLIYWYEQAVENKDNQEIHSLSKQIVAYEKRWSLPCYFTPLQA